MLILRPLSSNKLTQSFGQNKACIRLDPRGRPYTPYRVIGTRDGVCPINSVPFYPAIGMKGHNGEDWSCYYKEPIHFPVFSESKWWARAEVDFDGGIGVDVFSVDRIQILEKDLPKEIGKLGMREWKDNDGFVYVKFRFWHLYDVKLGNKKLIQVGVFADGRPEMKPEIKLGDCIGWGNSTGASSGDHLHWGMKIVAKNSMTLDNDNGYYGALDFSKFYQDDFILKVLGRPQQLTAPQILRKIAWQIRHINIRDSKILKAIANVVESFGEKVGTFINSKKK